MSLNKENDDSADSHLLADSVALNEHVTSAAVLPIADNNLFCSVASESTVASHPPRCPCGCIPNIRSLFEMAELRKQAKLKIANERGPK